MKKQADIKELIDAHGLTGLVDAAETMSWDDAEYLFHVTNSTLTLQRARIVARMGEPSTSPKELADLTMALKRVDELLGKYKRELEEQQEARTVSKAESQERDRLTELAAKYGM